jgi:hypothetical protein
LRNGGGLVNDNAERLRRMAEFARSGKQMISRANSRIGITGHEYARN